MSRFRPWQAIAFERFFGKRTCYVISPPGQGKSFLGIAWAVRQRELGRKVLIVTPRKLIQTSFMGTHEMRWDTEGRCDTPAAVGYLYSYKQPKHRLSTWLTQGVSDLHPYFVSTHQGVLAAITRITENVGGVGVEDLAVVVDEAHLLSERDDNQMGKLLRLLHAQGVPILIMTATPYRADGANVVPDYIQSEIEADGAVYTREFADAIDETEYLDGIESKVVVGQVMPELRRVLERVQEKDLHIVVKLPGVTSHHTTRLCRELNIPLDTQDPKLYFDRAIQDMCDDLGLTWVSVVDATEKGSPDFEGKSLSDLLDVARTVTDRKALVLPRVVIAQEKISMGVDCPWWTDAIMIGASRSPVLTVQFGTRSCRDHFSKKGRTVWFWTLVPEYWEPNVTPDDALQFAIDLIITKAVWLFVTGKGIEAPTLNNKSEDSEDEGKKSTKATKTPPDTSTRVPPSPNVLAQNLINALRDQVNGKPTENAAANLVLLRACMADIVVPEPGGSRDVPKHEGNQLPDLPPVDQMHDDQIMDESRQHVIRLARFVGRGEAKEYSAYLKAQAITPALITGMYRNKVSIGDISASTGWHAVKIQKTLEDAGLIPVAPKVPRRRGERW